MLPTRSGRRFQSAPDSGAGRALPDAGTEVLPPNTRPLVAASYNNIGVVYRKKGDLENALLQYQKALEVYLAVHGQEHRTWPRPVITLVLRTN